MLKHKTFFLLLLFIVWTDLYCQDETWVNFRGYVETIGLGQWRYDIPDDPVSRADEWPLSDEIYQGLSFRANQFLKIDSDVGTSFTISINEFLISGLASTRFENDFWAWYLDLVTSGAAPVLSSSPSPNALFYSKVGSYVLAVELERFVVNHQADSWCISLGLQRMSRGYNHAFSPFDFLNPQSPGIEKAKPKGILASRFIWDFSPLDSVEVYWITPEDPLEKSIWGSVTGFISSHFLGDIVDLQLQYNLLFPEVDPNLELDGESLVSQEYEHLAGAAFKVDIGCGIFGEFVFQINPNTDIEVLFESVNAAVGVDYTFGVGEGLYILFEYFYQGTGQLSSNKSLNELYSSNEWYLQERRFRSLNSGYEIAQYNYNHYGFLMTELKTASEWNPYMTVLVGFDTYSAQFSAGVNSWLNSNAHFSAELLVPFDSQWWDMEDGVFGEFGPINQGYKGSLQLNFKYVF